jgi:hypothetical protein
MELNIMVAGHNGPHDISERLLSYLRNCSEKALDHKAGLQPMLRKRRQLVLQPDHMPVYFAVKVAPHVSRKTVLLPVAGDGVRLRVDRDQHLNHVVVSAYRPAEA